MIPKKFVTQLSRFVRLSTATGACAFVTVALFTSHTARAANYAETGDAGDTPATAQLVTGQPPGTSLDRITGTVSIVNGISEGDMFQIFISNATAFSANTTAFVAGANNFDTQLFLFDSTGRGVFANDDSPNGGAQSTLPAGTSFLLAPGNYYLLITGSGRYPVSPSGLIFPNFTDGTTDQSTVVGPTGPGGALPISSFTGNSSEGGNYSITLTGAQFVVVPEPSTLVAALSGVAGLLVLRRRGRRSV